MFLLWLFFIIIVVLVGLGLVFVYRFDDDSFGFGAGLFLGIVGFLILIGVIFGAIDDHYTIKTEIQKINNFKEILKAEKILNVKDTTFISKMDPSILLEKAVEYNEQVIEWQNNNSFWRSAIYIPEEVDTLTLIK